MNDRLSTRAMNALFRNHPTTTHDERYGARPQKLVRERRDMLLAWSATRTDEQLLDCRNLGRQSLRWIRDHAAENARPDRDRLAADLHAAHLGCHLDYRGDVDCGGATWPCHTIDADRLIALGWTLHPRWTIEGEIHADVLEIVSDLDEERLTRALHLPYGYDGIDPEFGVNGRCRACGEDGVWSSSVDAAAIAKAYREDSDA